MLIIFDLQHNSAQVSSTVGPGCLHSLVRWAMLWFCFMAVGAGNLAQPVDCSLCRLSSDCQHCNPSTREAESSHCLGDLVYSARESGSKKKKSGVIKTCLTPSLHINTCTQTLTRAHTKTLPYVSFLTRFTRSVQCNTNSVVLNPV